LSLRGGGSAEIVNRFTTTLLTNSYVEVTTATQCNGVARTHKLQETSKTEKDNDSNRYRFACISCFEARPTSMPQRRCHEDGSRLVIMKSAIKVLLCTRTSKLYSIH